MSRSRGGHTPVDIHKLVLVTGPSGAGRSTTIHALEDLGYEAIDNLPLSFLPRLLDAAPHRRPLALGIDVRNRDFSTSAMLALLADLDRDDRVDADLLYLDCSAEVLVRRFSETRRRHPLAPAQMPIEGIGRELDLLAPIRARADLLIDTSALSPHDLCAEITRWYHRDGTAQLVVSLNSFSYRRGIPMGTDMLFDCRFLRNPYWQPSLRELDGREPRVAAYIAEDPRFAAFIRMVRELVILLLPAYVDEGKSSLAIGFGCTGGQHRSVAVTEYLAKSLAEAGWQVSKRHRELERRGLGGPVATDRGLKT